MQAYLERSVYVLCFKYSKLPDFSPMKGELTRNALTLKHFRASFVTASSECNSSPREKGREREREREGETEREREREREGGRERQRERE